jgi:molybdenum cofactor cytidylyltransferase
MGQPKQMLPWKGRTLVRHAAETALATAYRPILVVLGAAAAVCQGEIKDLAISTVENPNWNEGMGTSLARGMDALLRLEPEIPAVLFMLVDQPSLTSAYLEMLRSEWEQSPSSIVATRYETKGGTPAIFPREYFAELSICKGDQGARDILRRTNAKLLTPDDPILDLDTPERYQMSSKAH